jgi:hypothetical protein
MNGKAPNQSASLIYVVGIAGALLIVAMLVWGMQRYTSPAQLGQARAVERQKFLAELSQTQTLHDYAWQDQSKGLVRMPISNAMDLLVREYQNPAAARARMIERIDKATAPAPEKSEFE